MYSPNLGRFKQIDPIGYGGGMKLHAYVNGDPVDKVDPTGMATYSPTTGQTCRDWTIIMNGVTRDMTPSFPHPQTMQARRCWSASPAISGANAISQSR